MRAVYYEQFGERPTVETVPDPSPAPGGVVIEVAATGVCRSDWHGWMGHDADIVLPHVPGHELAGTIAAVDAGITRWSIGDRVTVPFVGGCGACAVCIAGDHHVCPDQFQPGFTHWGAWADYVAIDHADTNLVALPDDMALETAASLGCRFATSFRAVVDRARVQPEEWVAVHGCGGVGLAAIMISVAVGAQVIAIDTDRDALDRATGVGAAATVQAADDVVAQIVETTGGGAHVSIDAIGGAVTASNSIRCLRRRGRHVQVGLMVGDDATASIPFDRVLAWELDVLGSHGMQAHRYGEMLSMIAAGRLAPERLIGSTITLDRSIDALVAMTNASPPGITVIVM